MKRHGGYGVAAAGIMAIIIVAVVGGMIFEGNAQQSSQPSGASGGVGGDLSSGFSAIASDLRFAAGGGMGEVQTETIGLIADTFTGNSPIQPTCSATPVNSYIQLTNTGSGKGEVTGVTITYAGANNVFTISGPCQLGPAGSPTATMYILFKGPSRLPNSDVPQEGEPFVGTVAMTNGAHLPFTGKFYAGYPTITVAGTSLVASKFVKGQPTNATCGLTTGTGSYIMLNNTGTLETNATSITINSGNGTSTLPIVGNCDIGPGGTPTDVTYVLFGSKSPLDFAVMTGQLYNGTIALTDRSDVLFKGSFQ